MLPERLQTELNISTGDVCFPPLVVLTCQSLCRVKGRRGLDIKEWSLKDWIFFLSVLQCFFELK